MTHSYVDKSSSAITSADLRRALDQPFRPTQFDPVHPKVYAELQERGWIDEDGRWVGF